MRADEIILYTDLDGTALTDWDQGPVLPKSNLTAIRAFVDRGGIFSVASGREARDILRFFPGVPIRAPLVCGNGAVLYDAAAGRVLRVTPLPQPYKEDCVSYVVSHPGVCLVAADVDHIYQVTFGLPEKDAWLGDKPRPYLPVREFLEKDRIIKAVYVLTNNGPTMARLKEETALLPSAHLVNNFSSGPHYLEAVERSVTKGRGIQTACAIAGVSGRKLVCIGDYLNDLSMLRLADIPACPSNSQPEIIDVCSLVTCDNNTGAIADLLRRLQIL